MEMVITELEKLVGSVKEGLSIWIQDRIIQNIAEMYRHGLPTLVEIR